MPASSAADLRFLLALLVYTPVILLKTTVRGLKALFASRQYTYLALLLASPLLLITGTLAGYWPVILLGGILGITTLTTGLLHLHRYIQDQQVPVHATLLRPEWPRRAMVVFPHPDDEFTVAGTIQLLVAQQVTVTLVYLTGGNAGVTAGLARADGLVTARAAEMERARRLLGAAHLEILAFEDGQLSSTEPESLRKALTQLLEQYRPSLVITYDTQAGLYGHADHVAVAIRVREVCQSATIAAFVKRVCCVTIPPNQLRFYLFISPIFQQCFHRFSDSLPAPHFAVDIRPFARRKKKAVLAHRTQWRVLELLLPLFYLVPASWYFRLFDREYFSVLMENAPAVQNHSSQVMSSEHTIKLG